MGPWRGALYLSPIGEGPCPPLSLEPPTTKADPPPTPGKISQSIHVEEFKERGRKRKQSQLENHQNSGHVEDLEKTTKQGRGGCTHPPPQKKTIQNRVKTRTLPKNQMSIKDMLSAMQIKARSRQEGPSQPKAGGG